MITIDTTTTNNNLPKSKGHIGWTTSLEGNLMEVYQLSSGDVAWAPASCVIEIGGPNGGRRIGRWLCSKRAWAGPLGE